MEEMSVALFTSAGAGHEAASPQEEAAAGSAGSRVRGGRPEGQTGPQLGDEWVWHHPANQITATVTDDLLLNHVVVFQDGWTTSASRSTKVTLTRLVLTGECCTTWRWWVVRTFKSRHAAVEAAVWKIWRFLILLVIFWLRLCAHSLMSLVSQEDLLSLKVGSVLHHLSIKRAIQVLRLNAYEPSCLRRRPSDEVSHKKPQPARFKLR